MFRSAVICVSFGAEPRRDDEKHLTPGKLRRALARFCFRGQSLGASL
jgi:hypothetical protein